jgi:hypothetical protein
VDLDSHTASMRSIWHLFEDTLHMAPLLRACWCMGQGGGEQLPMVRSGLVMSRAVKGPEARCWHTPSPQTTALCLLPWKRTRVTCMLHCLTNA